MIVTLFKEFRADLNGADFYAFEEDQKNEGRSMWPHIHQRYVSLPQNERPSNEGSSDEKKSVKFAEDLIDDLEYLD